MFPSGSSKEKANDPPRRDGELDGQLPCQDSGVEQSQLRQRADLEGDMPEDGGGEGGDFVRLFAWAAAEKSARPKWMVRFASPDDLHTQKVAIEFRRGCWIFRVKTHVMDAGVLAARWLLHWMAPVFGYPEVPFGSRLPASILQAAFL